MDAAIQAQQPRPARGMIGRRIGVWWDLDSRYYFGRLVGFAAEEVRGVPMKVKADV